MNFNKLSYAIVIFYSLLKFEINMFKNLPGTVIEEDFLFGGYLDL